MNEDDLMFCPKNICIKNVYKPVMRPFIESLTFQVGAGFIPARSSIRAGMRAGINPAPTIKNIIQTG
jgi:hypothetical protein